MGNEKLIYIHVVSFGKSLKESSRPDRGYMDAMNDWYVIQQTSDKGGQITRVFEDINQVNHPHDALVDTSCEVIGSSIYIIGGRNVISDLHYYRANSGSKEIRRLDTRNPRDGWKTCCTLPFFFSNGESVVADGWLYLFAGDRHCFRRRPLDPWGYAVNLNSLDDNHVKAKKIAKPDDSILPPVASTSLSPGRLIAYMEEENTLYQLNCSQDSWTVYQKDLRPLPSCLTSSIATHDGILYIYDELELCLFSYDLANNRELPKVDLPNSPWFRPDELFQLIVLDKFRFCVMWYCRADVNEMYLYYNRFLVSYDPPKPRVVVEEKKIFEISGFKILNIVTLDPHSDAMTESLSCNSGVDI